MPTAKAEFVDFKVIKQAVTILQVLDHYGITESLKRSGDTLSGCCPIHGGDNSTQFRVSVSKNCFNCFGTCMSGGNVLDFVAKKEKVSVRAAALLIQQWFSVDSRPGKTVSPPEPAPQKTEAPGQEEEPTKVTPAKPEAVPATSQPKAESKKANEPLSFALKNLDAAHQYLAERGLKPETIAAFWLGMCSKGSMAGRIVIPIHNAEGKLVAYSGRWPGEPPEGQPKYKLPNGFLKSLEVYNLHAAAKESPAGPLIVVEGFFDCIKLWQSGIRRVVSVMGSSISDAQVALIGKVATPSGKVIILFDEDDAGRAGREQAVQKLSTLVFVKAVSPGRPGLQPDTLLPAELHEIVK
jgi:DNA primase